MVYSVMFQYMHTVCADQIRVISFSIFSAFLHIWSLKSPLLILHENITCQCELQSSHSKLLFLTGCILILVIQPPFLSFLQTLPHIRENMW